MVDDSLIMLTTQWHSVEEIESLAPVPGFPYSTAQVRPLEIADNVDCQC